MSSIKDQIITLVKQRHHSHKVALEQEKDPRSKHAIDLIARIREDSRLIEVIDSLPEDEPSKEVEEAAEEYADKHGFRVPYDGSNNYYDDVDVKASKEGFIAGAEWQKEQMMKEAVEAKVWESGHGFRDLEMDSESFRKALEGFKDGDKVKLFIVKEDDKG